VAASVEFANVSVLPLLDVRFSGRSYAAMVHNDLRPERIFTYQLPRAWNWGLAFYFRRELPEWSSGDPEPALTLTTKAGIEEIRALGRFHGEFDEVRPEGGVVRLVPIGAARR
jgi:hypothetical protein